MMEIRIHGRGGQGTVVASEILATAFFKEGRHVQAFPTFGVERRGAPVAAFVRIDDSPIRLRCQVERPNHVVILDGSLMGVIDVTAGLKEGGWILINSASDPHTFEKLSAGRWQVATVNAAEIARRHHLGTRTNPVVNTAILGAFSGISGLVALESVVQAVTEGVPLQSAENARAAREAFMEVQMAWAPA